MARSEALLKLPERLGPTSLDLNIVSCSSPRWGTVKKSSVATRKSSAFPSPATPSYHHHSSAGMQKGWNSERVPLHNNGIKRQGSAAGVLCSNKGRTLPSKWEDAERWILSPGSGDNGVRQSIVPPQRRPKSKSGPLGPPGNAAYNSSCLPSMYIFDGGNTGNFLAGSPFSAGVISVNGLANHSRSHYGGFAVRTEPCMARSVSVHGCSEVVSPPSFPSRDADENLYAVEDAAIDTSPTVSRKDMATQMSPHGSTCSSPGRSASFTLSTPSALPIMELQGTHSSKSQVRDVQIDERVTMTRCSKKHGAGNTGMNSAIVDDWRKRAADTRTPTWDVTETARIKREEAKITAWENLQMAKAEAAIRKLEMKLEKKRSSSMNKIMNKLRSAHKRAQEMRSSVLSNQIHEVTRTSHKATSFCRTRQMGSFSGCFTCPAF
ncbi:hypothetical protein F3Y22_tig00110683pilonHSYRG00103 [Hibiscus syriacus]|uniref:Remorin C-terminal domain-containing protein n=1 Tax=Hibiscus syriacus TaxID=106335 RepID=A0A6A2ZV14_HIBSY|nr:hypothetical protein F3Y22_tig00110683pilonHSYRG00103 [Hibiscus syriacus]